MRQDFGFFLECEEYGASWGGKEMGIPDVPYFYIFFFSKRKT
jgi:hypothetical protein